MDTDNYDHNSWSRGFSGLRPLTSMPSLGERLSYESGKRLREFGSPVSPPIIFPNKTYPVETYIPSPPSINTARTYSPITNERRALAQAQYDYYSPLAANASAGSKKIQTPDDELTPGAMFLGALILTATAMMINAYIEKKGIFSEPSNGSNVVAVSSYQPGKARINSGMLNLHSCADFDCGIVTTMPNRAEVKIKSFPLSGWAEIDYIDKSRKSFHGYSVTKLLSQTQERNLSAAEGESDQASPNAGHNDITVVSKKVAERPKDAGQPLQSKAPSP